MSADIPISEQIVQAVAERLSGLTTGNNFQFSLVEIIRYKRKNNPAFRHLQAIIIQHDHERMPDSDFPGNPAAIAWRLPLEIDVVVRLSDTDTTPIDQFANLVLAEVQRCLVSPVETWHTWDDLAFNTHFAAPQRVELEGEAGTMISFMLEIDYRISEDDPYTKR